MHNQINPLAVVLSFALNLLQAHDKYHIMEIAENKSDQPIKKVAITTDWSCELKTLLL